MPDRRIDWGPWSRAAFARAADERRLVLLLLTVSWSEACAAMRQQAYQDPRVVHAIGRGFVAIHVDADARPDIADRYSLDGWPTTVLLTPEGDILNGVTLADGETLATLLERTLELHAADPATIASRAAEARRARLDKEVVPAAQAEAPEGGVRPLFPAEIAEALLDAADGTCGGFVETPRAVRGDALLFLLRFGLASGDERALAHARRSALGIVQGSMFDPGAGVSRCAYGPGWDDPAPERDAATQAAALRLLAEGRAVFDDETWGEAARRVAECVRVRWLPPAAGHVPYAGVLADLAGAALVCGAAFDDRDLAGRALSALEQHALATYRPGMGLAHSADRDAPRLLADQVQAIATLLDTHELTGELPYSMLAEELGWFVVTAFADEETGAFRDRIHASDHADDPGWLAEPRHPFRANAQAAAALARLAEVSGEPAFAEAAAAAFAWTAARWRAQGLEAAWCGMAALHLIDWRLSGPSGGGHHTISGHHTIR